MKHLYLLLLSLLCTITVCADNWQKLTSGMKYLAPGNKYVVSEDVTINSYDKAALSIQGDGTAAVTIEIKENCTLTVKGENGGYGHVAYPAIEVPEGKTLIICGGGKLIATGGDCGQGDSGFGGGWGLCKREGTWEYAGGFGGRGGHGGSGGAPAIGGRSGSGGEGGAQTSYSDNGDGTSCQWDYDGEKGLSGNSGHDGYLGEGMGKVFILGNIQLVLRKGNINEISTSGGSGGTGSSWSYWIFVQHRYVCAGGGGGGGAGGNGLMAEYEIGGGGKGAGGGASGTTGERFYRNAGGRTIQWCLGRGGLGGSGTPAGLQGNDGVPNDDREFSDHIKVYCKNSESGGSIPSGTPNHGKVYANSFYPAQVGGRDIIRQLTLGLSSDIPQEAIFKIYLRKPNTLTGGTDIISYFDGMQLPESVDVPHGQGENTFTGYYDNEGQLVYDANGKLVTSLTRNMFVNKDGKVYIRHTDDVTFTARYTTTRVVHVHHVFGDAAATELAASTLSDEQMLAHPEFANRNKTLDFNEDVIYTISTTERETLHATGNTEHLSDAFVNCLAHSDVHGMDTKEVTLTQEDGDKAVYFFHRFKMAEMNWSYTKDGVSHDLNDGHMNTIVNDAGQYKQHAAVRYYTQVTPPLFKDDHGYRHVSWTVNGRKDEPLPSYVTKDACNFEAQFGKMKFNVVLQNAEQVSHITKFEGVENGEYEFESKLDFEVIPEAGYGISSIKTWNYADNTLIDADVLRKETISGVVRYKGHTTVPACDIFIKPEVERLVNHLYKTTHSIDDPNYYKKGYVMYYTVKHDEDGSEIIDKAYTDNSELWGDDIKEDTELQYRVGDPVHLTVVDAAVMDSERSVHPTVKIKYLTEAEMKDVKLEDVVDLDYKKDDYTVSRRYKYESPAVNAFFNIGYESYPIHNVTFSDGTGKNAGIKRLYRDSQLQYDSETKAANPLIAGCKDIATFMLDKSVGNGVITASYMDAEQHEHALNIYRRVGKGLFNQLRYYYFTMPDADVKIQVNNPSGSNADENIAYAITECEGIGSFIAEAPEYAREGQYVTFHVNLHDNNDMLTDARVMTTDGEIVDVLSYDETTRTGTFIMPASDVSIVVNRESTYQGDSEHFATIEWDNRYYMPYVYEETTLLPQNVKAYVVENLTEKDGTYTLSLAEFPVQSLPSNMPVILCSDHSDINIIPLGLHAYMDVDNMLTYSEQNMTVSEMLSTEAMAGYDAILKLTQMQDGVAFTGDNNNIYSGDVLLPVRSEWFSNLPLGTPLAAYIVRTINPDGIENVSLQLRPVTDGVYDLSGKKVADSAEQIKTLPLGIYIVNAKRVINK